MAGESAASTVLYWQGDSLGSLGDVQKHQVFLTAYGS